MKKIGYFFIAALLMMSCSSETKKKHIDLQGHRGCRGIMPENTTEGFVKALEIGVTTLEMDLVISADKKVIVSHEPFFSHEISRDSLGNDISQQTEMNHNIYQLTYKQIRSYDVGNRIHERFPEQQKLKTYKPAFTEMLEEVEEYVAKKNLPLPYYNVEIKRRSEWDGVFHPEVDVFTGIVVSEVQGSGFKERFIIQSFDKEALRIARKLDPEIKLALLVENDRGPEKNVEELGFVPEVYSPEHIYVDKALVTYCRENEMELIPWTINQVDRMQELCELGVDGIITDYPDRFHELAELKNIKIR